MKREDAEDWVNNNTDSSEESSWEGGSEYKKEGFTGNEKER